MMTHLRIALYATMKAVALCCALLGGTNDALAQLTNPTCPTARKPPPSPWRDAWRQYITSKGLPVHYLSVRFDAMPVADGVTYTGANDPLGVVWSGECYFMNYEGNGVWIGSGGREGKKASNLVTGLYTQRVPRFGGADASRYEMTIYGQLFTYNEAGEVHEKDLGLVGHLYCTHPKAWNACFPNANKRR